MSSLEEMDSNILATAGISTSGVAILLIVYKIVQAVVNKKIVSSCCGRRVEMGVAVGEMRVSATATRPESVKVTTPVGPSAV